MASNLANVDAVAGPDSKAYKARQVVFRPHPWCRQCRRRACIVHQGKRCARTQGARPRAPPADEQGYVNHSNVNAVEEMVNMISASRSYQNNVEVMNTAKSLLLKTPADWPVTEPASRRVRMIISPTHATAGTTTGSTGPLDPNTDPRQRRDRFLKLLVAQLNNQDR